MAFPETDVIILYDLPSTLPGNAWSANTWKTRFALNYKGIPYRTQWVEYPDIVSVITPLGVKSNPPSPMSFPYTLPVIYDPRTRTAVMDSIKIALYLDETYPDTPAVLPSETRVFQHAFQDPLFSTVHEKLVPFLFKPCIDVLNPPSAKYFRETREAAFGRKAEDFSPPEKRPEQFAALEKGFSILASWFEAAGDGRLLLTGGGPTGEGGRVTHADFAIAGLLIMVRDVLGAKSEEWQRIESFDGGRWKRFLDFVAQWADTSR